VVPGGAVTSAHESYLVRGRAVGSPGFRDAAVPHADREASMDAAAVALVALVVFAWGLFSARLGRADLSAPIIFVTVGLLLSEGLHVIELDVSQEAVKLPPAATLVWRFFVC